MNELTGIYKFNAAGNIDIRLINSPFNTDTYANNEIILICHVIIKLSQWEL